MKYIFFIFFNSFCFSQVSDFEEILIDDMCKTFIENDGIQDSLRVEMMYEKHLYPYFTTIEEEKIDSVGMSIYFRLQKRCPQFLNFLNQIEPLNSGETEFLDEKLQSVLKKDELRKFKKTAEFYYVEDDGLSTKVKIRNGIWKEAFDNDTFSMNKISWLKENKFELTFLESNNEVKKSLSKKGEKYCYEIIAYENDYFLIQYEIPQINQFVVFKLHIQD